MEQGDVAVRQSHRVAESHAPLVHRVHCSDRNPELADALLRVKVIGLPARAPAVVDGANRNPDTTVKAAAELSDAIAQILRCWDQVRSPGWRPWTAAGRQRGALLH